MFSKTIQRRLPLRGFTLLELQVAIVLLSFGIATIGSLMAAQARLMQRLEVGFKPGSTLYLTRSADPWVKQIGAPARLTTTTVTETAPTPVATPANTVVIVEQNSDLKSETITVTAAVTQVP